MLQAGAGARWRRAVRVRARFIMGATLQWPPQPPRMTQIPASSSSGDVPGMGRRQFMNLLTFGSVTGVALGALYPVVNYFIPPQGSRFRWRPGRQG